MRRIYAFAVGLVLLVAPLAATVTAGLATADPGIKPVDYQQVADTVIARGLAQRGVPYSWGGGGVNGPSLGTGTGAKTVGFDASGLIQYAYAGAGLKLPRSSGQMYRVGQRVMPAQAQKGDLLFYGPEGTQAVALYMGNNQMLEVGDAVQVSPVRSSNMAPYLVRILGATPAQTVPGAPAPAQTVPGQTAPAQTVPGQTGAPAQTVPGQVAAPAQTVPGQTAPAQTVPGQVAAPAQTLPGQTAPSLPAQTVPGQTIPSLPGQTAPAAPAPAAPAPGLPGLPGLPPSISTFLNPGAAR